jgi:hypothetical protein
LRSTISSVTRSPIAVADRRLRERRRRAVRELAGVEEREPRVAREARAHEQNRREHHQPVAPLRLMGGPYA